MTQNYLVQNVNSDMVEKPYLGLRMSPHCPKDAPTAPPGLLHSWISHMLWEESISRQQAQIFSIHLKPQ